MVSNFLHWLVCNLTHPKTGHHFVFVHTKLLGIPRGELADSESPAVKSRAKGNGTFVGIYLDITERLVEIGSDDDVDGLNDTREVLVQIFFLQLQLQKSTIDLVDDDDRLDTLSKSLSENGLGLDADTFNGIDDDEGTVGDTKSSSDFRREINVTGRVDQVDQELVLLNLDRHILQVLRIGQLGVEGDGGRLDSDATFLFVRTSIRKPSLAGLGCRDDTGALDEGIGEGGFSVVDCGQSVSDASKNDIGATYREQ